MTYHSFFSSSSLFVCVCLSLFCCFHTSHTTIISFHNSALNFRCISHSQIHHLSTLLSVCVGVFFFLFFLLSLSLSLSLSLFSSFTPPHSVLAVDSFKQEFVFFLLLLCLLQLSFWEEWELLQD
jgi:hypothetical protein